jgi:ornithine carbamoyltransferase
VSSSAPTPFPFRIAAGRQAPSRAERLALIDSARRLQLASHAGLLDKPLRGKNLALVTDTPESPDTQALRHAAVGLGARVAMLRSSDAQTADVANTARLLGRLYDAIHCEGLAADVVRRIEMHAGVPVFDDLTHEHRALRELAQCLEPDPADTANGIDTLRYVLQAVLMNSLA